MPEIFYEPPRRRRVLLWPATITLLAVNVGVYLLQLTVLKETFVDARLALSVDGLRQGFVWQLLSFQFLHGSIWHLLFNCWALFMFGREVEWVLRTPRFLIMYFTGGIVGGLFQVFVMLMWPQYFGTGAVVGASAGIFAVVAAFAMLFPHRQLILLLVVVPIKMKARSMLWLSLIITAAGISLPHTWIAVILGGNVAHAAHLGGILTGLALSGGRTATARAAQISSYYSQPPPLPEDPRS
jgi:membrane associated rhomboid family serine protease